MVGSVNQTATKHRCLLSTARLLFNQVAQGNIRNFADGMRCVAYIFCIPAAYTLCAFGRTTCSTAAQIARERSDASLAVRFIDLSTLANG